MASQNVAQRPFSRPTSFPSRPKLARLKLQELEPWVSPSSLLANLPLLGAMVDGSWLMGDEDDARLWTPTNGDDAASPLTIDHQALTISSDDFAPVVPSELSPRRPDAQTPIPQQADALPEPSATVLALLADPADAEAEGDGFYALSFPLNAWHEAGRLPSVSTDSTDQADLAADDSVALDTDASASVSIPQRVRASESAAQPDNSANDVVYVVASDDGPSRPTGAGSGEAAGGSGTGSGSGEARTWVPLARKSAGGVAARFAHEPTALDTTGPRVTGVTPAPGATVAAPATVDVQFDEDLDLGTVTDATFKVSR